MDPTTRGLTCERALLDAAAGVSAAPEAQTAPPAAAPHTGDDAGTSRAGADGGEGEGERAGEREQIEGGEAEGEPEEAGGEDGGGGGGESSSKSVESMSLAEALREGALAGVGDLPLPQRRNVYNEVLARRIERRCQEIQSAPRPLGIVTPSSLFCALSAALSQPLVHE